MLVSAWLPTGVTATPTTETLLCTARAATREFRWRLDIETQPPAVRVDGRAVAAAISPTHVELRLAPDGPILTLGRRSGRLLLSAPDGRAMARGHCRPLSRT